MCFFLLAWAAVSVVGSMAASGRGKYDSVTQRHAIKVATTASVEEVSLAVGESVGYNNILSAARMNSAVVLFLKQWSWQTKWWTTELRLMVCST